MTAPSVSERLRELAKQITKAADTSGVTHINAKGSAEHVLALATEIEAAAQELRETCALRCEEHREEYPEEHDGVCGIHLVADALAPRKEGA